MRHCCWGSLEKRASWVAVDYCCYSMVEMGCCCCHWAREPMVMVAAMETSCYCSMVQLEQVVSWCLMALALRLGLRVEVARLRWLALRAEVASWCWLALRLSHQSMVRLGCCRRRSGQKR